MEALIVLGSLVFLILFGFICVKVSNHCDDKYDYNPFSLSLSFFMALVWVLIISAALCMPKDATLPYSNQAWLNTYVLFSAGVLIWLATFIRIVVCTSFPIALFVIFVQSLFSGIILILAFLAVALLGSSQNETGREKNYSKK